MPDVKWQPIQECVCNKLWEEEAESIWDYTGQPPRLNEPDRPGRIRLRPRSNQTLFFPLCYFNSLRVLSTSKIRIGVHLNLLPRRFEPGIFGANNQERVNKNPNQSDEDPRQRERPPPPEFEHRGGDDRSDDVPDRHVRVPDAHDQAALRLSEPIAYDGDDGGPSGGLEEAADDLDG